MIDHMTLYVRDLGSSSRFYENALAPLGIARQMSYDEAHGFGTKGKAFFWIRASSEPTPRTHVAFHALSRAAVDSFHRAAVGAGARDDGPPGVRAHYAPTYYAAFVVSPDGHNLEAVHRGEAKKVKKAKKAPAAKSKRVAASGPKAVRSAAKRGRAKKSRR